MVSPQDHKKLQHIAGFLEIPSDILYDLPKITLIGNLQLYIENHRGIIAYAPEAIRIAASTGEVEILGRELIIRSISREEIYLDGQINGIRYHQ
ncbi:MAG: sporulation protein YqfC [Clostridia bacterium]|nr:sporulation protein YqfC [Clostridia bacterium]